MNSCGDLCLPSLEFLTQHQGLPAGAAVWPPALGLNRSGLSVGLPALEVRSAGHGGLKFIYQFRHHQEEGSLCRLTCRRDMQQDRQSHSVLPTSLLQPGVNPVLGLESPVLDHSEDQGKKSSGLNTKKKGAGKIRCCLGAQCLKEGKENP